MRDSDQQLLWEAYIAEKDKHAHMPGGGGGGPDAEPVATLRYGGKAKPIVPPSSSQPIIGDGLSQADLARLKRQAEFVNKGHLPFWQHFQPADFRADSKWLQSPGGKKMLQQMYDHNFLSHGAKRRHFRHLYDPKTDSFRK